MQTLKTIPDLEEISPCYFPTRGMVRSGPGPDCRGSRRQSATDGQFPVPGWRYRWPSLTFLSPPGSTGCDCCIWPTSSGLGAGSAGQIGLQSFGCTQMRLWWPYSWCDRSACREPCYTGFLEIQMHSLNNNIGQIPNSFSKECILLIGKAHWLKTENCCKICCRSKVCFKQDVSL